jgi:anti-sigma factor RsiW
MICLRLDIKRYLLAYVDGTLDPQSVDRVERHLLDCFACRAETLSLREGRNLARRIDRHEPERDLWKRLDAALDDAGEVGSVTPADAVAVPRRRRAARPALAVGFAAVLALAASAGFVALPLRDSSPVPSESSLISKFDNADFALVRIADIPENTKPHIVAEGRVTEVGVDPEEGHIRFKLVDDLHADAPFVVCEVIPPFRIAAPAVGSRVRVYGVSRFDSQRDREWYEIHPVLRVDQLAN